MALSSFSQNKHQQKAAKTGTAVFGMGCFWKTDAIFGGLPGILSSQTGYAGGNSPAPTYREKGEHIETVQLVFEPAQMGFAELLQHFLGWHQPAKPAWKRGYASAIIAQNDQQYTLAEEALAHWEHQHGQQAQTLLLPFRPFYPAEERHQKYYLRKQPELMETVRPLFFSFEEFVYSTAAARINSFLAGYGSPENMEEALSRLSWPEETKSRLTEKATLLKNGPFPTISCSCS